MLIFRGVVGSKKKDKTPVVFGSPVFFWISGCICVSISEWEILRCLGDEDRVFVCLEKTWCIVQRGQILYSTCGGLKPSAKRIGFPKMSP